MFRMPTGVVRHLFIINVLMYFGTLFMGEPVQDVTTGEVVSWGRLVLAVFPPGSAYFQPFQVFTHMFMHSDIGHLFFNMLSLYFFGPAIEAALGEKRFLLYYILTGLGALALHMVTVYYQVDQSGLDIAQYGIPMLGASGCVFGVLAAFGYLFPNQVIQLLFPPIPMKAKYFVLIFGGLELYYGVAKYSDGIAHYAHVGGAITGLLILLYWNGFRFRS